MLLEMKLTVVRRKFNKIEALEVIFVVVETILYDEILFLVILGIDMIFFEETKRFLIL